MTEVEVPNWLRIILLILTLASFIPQLHRTYSRKTSSGISTHYLLFNLISATEQFALTFYYVVNHTQQPEELGFAHFPVDLGDWLNLAQTTVVAVLWLVLFTLCMYHPSNHRDATKRFAITVYTGYFFTCVFPVLAHAFYGKDIEYIARMLFSMIWHDLHTLIISYFVTGLGIASFSWQAREMNRDPSNEGLSRTGLAAQALVFSLLAVSWTMRVVFLSPWKWYGGFRMGLLVVWYQYVGWAAVDNAVFAVVQAGLLWVVVRRGVEEDGETAPLLHA